jgi:hypothetical protein
MVTSRIVPILAIVLPSGILLFAFDILLWSDGWKLLLVLVNVGAIGLLILFLPAINRLLDREILMKLSNLLLLRDMAIETRFLNFFPPEERAAMRKMLRTARGEGHADVIRGGLAAVIPDPKRAQQMRDNLRDAELGPN